jgi:hypothetical protein
MIYLLDQDNGQAYDMHDHKVEAVVMGKVNPKKYEAACKRAFESHNAGVRKRQSKDRKLRLAMMYFTAETFADWLCRHKGYRRFKFESVDIF